MRDGSRSSSKSRSGAESDDDIVIEEVEEGEGRKRAWQAERTRTSSDGGDKSSIAAYASKVTDLRDKLNKKKRRRTPSGSAPGGAARASRSSSIEIISVRSRSR